MICANRQSRDTYCLNRIDPDSFYEVIEENGKQIPLCEPCVDSLLKRPIPISDGGYVHGAHMESVGGWMSRKKAA